MLPTAVHYDMFGSDHFIERYADVARVEGMFSQLGALISLGVPLDNVGRS